jgi:hypothetical protein
MMLPSAFLGRFLSMLAVLGLAVLPIARPAMARAETVMQHHQTVTAATHMHGHAAHMDDHDCCPKQAPASHCDADCLAMCAAQFFSSVTQGAGLGSELGPAALTLPRNDADADGLRERPPPRPPKI